MSVGLYAIETGKFPKNSERLPFATHMTAARGGSIEFEIGAATIYGAAVLLYSVNQADVSGFLLDWIMGIVNKTAGRNDEAMELVVKMADRLLGSHEEVLRNQSRMIDRLCSIIENRKMGRAALDFVKTTENRPDQIIAFEDEQIYNEIDEDLAKALRNGGQQYTTEVENLVLIVDGFSHHNRRLKIVHPEDTTRYTTARIIDPEFRFVPNVYLEAAAERGQLEVTAKVVRYQGQIRSIYVMAARRP